MIPKFPNFMPLSIDLRWEIADHLRLTQRDICELCVGNLFIWTDFDRPQVTLVNNNVCVLISPPNETPYFLEPFGTVRLTETVDACLRQSGRLSRVSELFAAQLPAGRYKTEPLRNHFDYIYETGILAGLKGKIFDGKRNHIKRFKQKYPGYEYVPLTPAFTAEALALFEKWFAVREESKFFPRLAHTAQKGAIETAFRYFKELDLIGGALLIDKKLRGFTLGSPIREDLVSVHFMYGDPEVQGAPQIILWEACNKTYSAFKYADLEQDLGIPGLRTMKLSYHPLKLEKKFEITKL